MTIFLRNSVFALVIFMVGWLLFGAPLAASCCSSAATGGVGRLLAHERALVELSSAGRYLLGSFDDRASFKAGHIPHLPHLVIENELQVMMRLLDHVEPFARIPVRIQKSSVRTGSNLADITVGIRAPVIKENSFNGWPGITLFTSTKMPTGTQSSSSNAVDNESITSMGEWQFSLGTMLEKELYGITYGLGYGFSFGPDLLKGSSLQAGTIHALLMTLGFLVHEGGFLSFSLSTLFHGKAKADDRYADNSDRRKLSLGTSYSLYLHSHIKVNGQVGMDMPIDGLGKNFNDEFFVRLGMRFGVF